MKLKKNISLFLIIISTFLLFSHFCYASRYKYNIDWNYWRDSLNFTEKIQAFNLPDSIRTIMSTQDLLETMFSIPLVRFIALNDNVQQAYRDFDSTFNVIREIESRSDSDTLIYNFYHTLSQEKDYIAQSISAIMLTNQDRIARLDTQRRVLIISECINNCRDKDTSGSFFSSHSIKIEIFLLGKVLYSLDSEFKLIADNNSEITYFLESSLLYNDELITLILTEASSFIQQ